MPLNTEEVNLIFGTLHMTKSHKAASSTAATKTKSDRPSGKQSGMVQSKRMQKHRQSSKTPLRAPVKILIIATVAIVVLLLLDAVLSSIMRPIAIERADNTRKADIVNTVTELMDGFLKKNNGKFPKGGTDGAYTRPDFTDPDGTEYRVVVEELLTGEIKEAKTFNHTVYVYTHATCDGGVAKYSENPRRYAIMYHLESGESFCHKDNEGQDGETVILNNNAEIRNKETDKTGKTTIAAFLEQSCEFRYDYQFDNSARLITADGKYYDSYVDMSKKYNIIKGQTHYPDYGAAFCDAKITGRYNTKDVVRMEVWDGSTNAFTDTVDEKTGEFSINQSYYVKPDLIGAPTGESQIVRVLFIDKYDNVVTQITFLYNVTFSDANKNFINEWRQRIDNL